MKGFLKVIYGIHKKKYTYNSPNKSINLTSTNLL